MWKQPCESTCNALDTLISGANDSVGNCLRDTLCTEINCIESNNTMTVNLTFFPCNGTVSIHYLVILGSEDIAANVTTSEDYSGTIKWCSDRYSPFILDPVGLWNSIWSKLDGSGYCIL